MRWTALFSPTLREVPAEAEAPSHQLLLRAGFIRQLGAGIYSYLPLARRTLLKIERIIREEMNRIGGQEFYLPALHPAELWQQSGRWEVMGDTMFRLQDRGGRLMCLGMTHEEVFATLAREVRSYRDLPQIWYQIQIKFRDEPRPRSGLLRIRQFVMKDSYSLDVDFEGLDASYRLHDQAYRAIFDRCGLRYTAVEASSGAMGGSESQEFMVETEAGEDAVAACECGYAANLEKAVSPLTGAEDPDGEDAPSEIHTPGRKSIQEISEFLDIPRSRQIKSLVYIVEDQPVLLLLRGDHQLNETLLAEAVETDVFRAATGEEIREHFGADAGSLGPVGVASIRILADPALEGRRQMVCGANRDDYHLQHVSPGRDFQAAWHPLREVESGDPCPVCGRPLRVSRAMETGHIFKLGTRYGESMGARVLTREGKEVPIVMGSYGIGLERVMVAAAELYHDEAGIVWPRGIAPFEVVITLLRPDDEKQRLGAEELYDELSARGVDCLLDDREERPGVKFKDSELIGIPVRLTVGNRFKEGVVELFSRRDKEKKEVPAAEAVAEAAALLEAYPL